MHNDTDILSSVIKSARENAGITIEALADKIEISERYLYHIENEQKKPSFDILLKLIRALAINSDLIFYPENPCEDTVEKTSSVCSTTAMNCQWRLSRQL